MSSLVCTVCATAYGDDAPDVCAECNGKLVASAVLYASQLAEVDAIDAAFERYHAAKADPTYSEGCLFKRQAGG